MANGIAGAWRVFSTVEIFFHDLIPLNGHQTLAKPFNQL
jgi:hypothetical protein